MEHACYVCNIRGLRADSTRALRNAEEPCAQAGVRMQRRREPPRRDGSVWTERRSTNPPPAEHHRAVAGSPPPPNPNLAVFGAPSAGFAVLAKRSRSMRWRRCVGDRDERLFSLPSEGPPSPVAIVSGGAAVRRWGRREMQCQRPVSSCPRSSSHGGQATRAVGSPG